MSEGHLSAVTDGEATWIDHGVGYTEPLSMYRGV